MDEITIKLIFKAEMKRRRDDLTWILEMLMSEDYDTGYIIDKIKGRIRALKKQEEYK